VSDSIWDPPYLPVKIAATVAIEADANGCVTLWLEGHGAALTNEETSLLLRTLCPTQAQVDADYDQMFAALTEARASYSTMSDQWEVLCRHWHDEALRLRGEAEAKE
jgi:hypothetical protein